MKAHILAAREKLSHGCDRAQQLRAIFEHMRASAPAALDSTDILRAAVMLSVSAFDLFLHEIYRLEVLARLASAESIPALKVPFDAVIKTGVDRVNLIDDCVRHENSYKSFVSPDKLADCLRVLVEKPWDKISKKAGLVADDLKANLRGVVDLRNRIAHEADVNPAYAGIALWPIYSADVDGAIEFIRQLGCTIAVVVDEA